MSRFSDACVVVTGGASGIGEATARGIVAEGGRVLIADLQEELGQSLAEELARRARRIESLVGRSVSCTDWVTENPMPVELLAAL